MSQIFDALLRSEAERDGADPVSQAEATELLQRVERHAASKWASAILTNQHDAAIDLEDGASFGAPTAAPAAAALDTSGVAYSGQLDERQDPLSQFKSIYVSLPANSRLVSLSEQENSAAEAFRLLGVRLRDLRRAQPLKKILITSSIPREGKSTVAANLACALAHKTGEKTLLLEGDVRRPSQMQMFNVGSIPGLCEWLQNDPNLPPNVYRLEGAGIWVLPAGKAPAAPLELLQSKRLPVLINQLGAWFDWIIIDSPPVLPLADTSIWTRMVDGILLVARQGTTEKEPLERTLQALEKGKLLGALLNCSKASAYSRYYYRPTTAA